MNIFLKKLVDQGFMPVGNGQYIEDAIANKESFIISGHKGWGILPLMAAISATAKSQYNIKLIKDYKDMEEKADYQVIGDIKNIDYSKLIEMAIMAQDSSFISLKDPDHPYSIYKILKDIYNESKNMGKTIHILECAKIDDENKLSKITKVTMDKEGKIKKVKF